VPHPSEFVPWTRYVGAWLAIGCSPGALVLGGQLVDRRDGALPVLWLALGMLLMAALLGAQALLGLRPPLGHGTTFAEMSRSYLPTGARAAVGVLITCGMVGWTGFSIGIGAESLSRITGASHIACAGGLGAVVLVLATRDVRRWNVVAVGTTLGTLALSPLLLASLDRMTVPVTLTTGGGGEGVVVLAAFVGYVAVFMVRSPDFSAGLEHRSDLAMCVAALVVPAVVLLLIGATMRLSIADAADATLAGLPDVRVGSLPVGDLMVVLAVMAPAISSAFSGGLALHAFTGAPLAAAKASVAGVGIVLGMLEFHLQLVDWLALLAGVAPPVAVPFWLEAARRRRGRAASSIPSWTWVPPALGGGLLIVGGVTSAPLIALAAAALLTGVWSVLGRRTEEQRR
jgi:hypothetical protein